MKCPECDNLDVEAYNNGCEKEWLCEKCKSQWTLSKGGVIILL